MVRGKPSLFIYLHLAVRLLFWLHTCFFFYNISYRIFNHRNPLTTPHEPPYPTNRKIPTNHWVGWIPIFACIYVCMCVSRHRGHTVHVRDLYFWIYRLHIDEKKGFLDFSKKSVFRFFSSFCHFPRSDVHAKLVHGVLWIHIHPGLQSVFLF